jgi:hypothetical protein
LLLQLVKNQRITKSRKGLFMTYLILIYDLFNTKIVVYL